jgi:hypothetical protein
MTHDQWIEFIKDRLEGIPTLKEKRFKRGTIEQYISLARDQIISKYNQQGAISLDAYCKEFTVDILSDTIGFYSITPCNICSLTDIQDAIREIGNGDELQFVPMSADLVRVLSNTDAGDVSTITSYSLIQNSIYGLIVRYYKMMASPPSTVIMRIVASFDSYGNEEQVRIPCEPEKLVEIIVNIAQGTPKVDMINNNNGYTPAQNAK